jgi:hypothetical protein
VAKQAGKNRTGARSALRRKAISDGVLARTGLTDLRLIFECRHFDFGVNASDADRCVILMAPDFQPTYMGGCDPRAQRERRAHVPRHKKWPALAYKKRWFDGTSHLTHVFAGARRSIWPLRFGNLRSVGATERTNRHSLTAFGRYPRCAQRHRPNPPRVWPIRSCPEPGFARHESLPAFILLDLQAPKAYQIVGSALWSQPLQVGAGKEFTRKALSRVNLSAAGGESRGQ